LEPPLSEAKVRALKVGDVVLINGPIITGRDTVHHYLLHHDSPCDLRGAVFYHCGPVMLKEGEKWRVVAAGPTTSMREEPYEADIIKRFGIRAVMGKGGMGKKTLAALKECGAVYLHAIGGAAQFYARCLPQVTGVDLLEFGIPEAMWHYEARDFLAIVTMDAHGNSLHEDVEAATGTELEKVGAQS
jgi:fumarate hydratase class I